MTAPASPVVSDEEIVGELRAAWAEVSRGYARCWAAMVEVARRTTTGWETAEIAAALTFTARRADYELSCADTLLDHLPQVYTALASGQLDHHKARVFTDYLHDVTPAQAERICARLVPVAPGWTTGQLAARLLREVQAIDPDYTRRTYQQAVRERGVHGYLDHTGTAVLTGTGLPAGEAAAAAARLEALADQLRAAGYPATINQTRADLYLRLLDGTLEGLTTAQIQDTMLRLGPLAPADPGPTTDPVPDAHTNSDPAPEPSPHPGSAQPDRSPPHDPTPEQPPPAEQPTPTEGPEQPAPAEGPEQPAPAEQPAAAEGPEQPAPAEQPAAAEGPEQPAPAEQPAAAEGPEQPAPAEQPAAAEGPEQPAPAEQPAAAEGPEQPAPAEQPAAAEGLEGLGCGQRPRPGTPRGSATPPAVRYGVEVRVRLSTLLGLDDHPAELPGWGPIPAAAARELVAAQHHAEWRIAVVDAEGYLLHGDLTRRRPRRVETRDERARDDRVAEVVGGIVEIALPVTMLTQLPALAAEHPQWARVLHGITGSWTHRDHARAALDAHPHRRFAHAALRRHVQMRDRHCVGIGCRRRAAATDLDHTHDHAHGGPTVTINSGPCCARDHTRKHQGGWTLTQPQAGHFTWTSPLGQTYHTRGEPLIPDLPSPLPRDPDPDPRGLPMMDEGPILHRPEPLPPPARPPPTPLPDDPPF